VYQLRRRNTGAVRCVPHYAGQTAIANLDEIVAATDSLMVARGDLGIECPLEDLPVIQRRAVKACFNLGKPVIIATHTLESMISSPVPTRAEITDVANAVYEKADCVMLSGETTVGKYPLECVQVLDRIARRIEQEGPFTFAEPGFVQSDKVKLLQSAVLLAHQMPNTGLLTFTRQGNMATALAGLRPSKAPIFAMTNSIETLRQLRILRSVEPFYLEHQAQPNRTIESAIALLAEAGHVQTGDKLIVATDLLTASKLVDTVQLRIVP